MMDDKSVFGLLVKETLALKKEFAIPRLLTVLYCYALYCIALYLIALHCTVLHCIVLYCIVLYCIVLYCIVLYCIVLYCSIFRFMKSHLLLFWLMIKVVRKFFDSFVFFSSLASTLLHPSILFPAPLPSLSFRFCPFTLLSFSSLLYSPPVHFTALLYFSSSYSSFSSFSLF